jgi:hypothetical protein
MLLIQKKSMSSPGWPSGRLRETKPIMEYPGIPLSAVCPETETGGRRGRGWLMATSPPLPGCLNPKFTLTTQVKDVKTFGAGDRPNGRTRNWKSLPFHQNLMYFLVEGCKGMWK